MCGVVGSLTSSDIDCLGEGAVAHDAARTGALSGSCRYVFAFFGTTFITVACTAATYVAASHPPFTDQCGTQQMCLDRHVSL